MTDPRVEIVARALLAAGQHHADDAQRDAKVAVAALDAAPREVTEVSKLRETLEVIFERLELAAAWAGKEGLMATAEGDRRAIADARAALTAALGVEDRPAITPVTVMFIQPSVEHACGCGHHWLGPEGSTCSRCADRATPPAPVGEAMKPLRYCEICKSWNSKPCGQQCAWTPACETLEQMEARMTIPATTEPGERGRACK